MMSRRHSRKFIRIVRQFAPDSDWRLDTLACRLGGQGPSQFRLRSFHYPVGELAAAEVNAEESLQAVPVLSHSSAETFAELWSAFISASVSARLKTARPPNRPMVASFSIEPTA